MSKEKTQNEEVIPESQGDVRDPEPKGYACTDCGLHYRTKNLADACKAACDKGMCDSEITAQAIERNEKVKEKVAEADAETTQDFEAMWKRALADYQNLVKEMSAERVRMRKDALRDVVERLLPIVDNFNAAHAALPAEALAQAGKAVEAWITGVGHIRKQMEDMLSEFGVTRIETVGKPFDANLMEAVGESADAEALADKGASESGTVLRETMAGFKLGETIIRPAKVITVK